MEDLGERFTIAFQRKYDVGVADERARCIKVLEDLRATKDYSLTGRILTLDDAIAALSLPVASSPVGGDS